MIKVAAGIYQPVVIDVDGITIKEAEEHTNPVIDATGFPNGLRLLNSVQERVLDNLPSGV
jgi:hypothetical protein